MADSSLMAAITKDHSKMANFMAQENIISQTLDVFTKVSLKLIIWRGRES